MARVSDVGTRTDGPQQLIGRDEDTCDEQHASLEAAARPAWRGGGPDGGAEVALC